MRHLWIMAAMAIMATATLAADSIRPSPDLPATSPWNLSALSQAPAFQWIDRDSPVHSLAYASEPYNEQPTSVFAYYASPATLKADSPPGRKFPAVVLVHGGGGTAFAEWANLWAQRGYAAIAMDLAGSQPTAQRDSRNRPITEKRSDGGPGQGHEDKFGHMDQPPTQHWVYHAVAAVIRAHSLIRSFDDVDPNRTAITGISWGGYLTCIVTGLDNRFAASVPVYGCGYIHEQSPWTRFLDELPLDERERWIALYEPSRYLPAARAPMFFVNGTNDNAYWLAPYFKSYSLPRGDRNLRITVNMPHSHPAGWAPPEIGRFIDHYLLGEVPLATVGPLRVDASAVSASIRAMIPLVSGELHYTTDGWDTPNNQRQWISRPIEVLRNSIRAETPPRDAAIWFITLTDANGSIISTELMFKDQP